MSERPPLSEAQRDRIEIAQIDRLISKLNKLEAAMVMHKLSLQPLRRTEELAKDIEGVKLDIAMEKLQNQNNFAGRGWKQSKINIERIRRLYNE